MLEIRKARGTDAKALLDYCKKIGGQSDNLLFGSEGVNITEERESEYLERIYLSDKDLYLVAVLDEKIVGGAHFSAYTKPRLAHRGEFSISVDQTFWGQHIGSSLMEVILDFAKNIAKVEMISLEVRSDNVRAISLYEKYGFEKTGTFKGYMKLDNQYIDCDYMQLFL